jgi:hypothetical protein
MRPCQLSSAWRKALALRLQDEVDDRGGAAMQRGERSGLVIVTAEGAHERHVQMHVRVDAAGHHELAFCVDHFGTGCMQVVPDGFDVFAFDEDIGAVEVGGGDYGSVLDEEGHGRWVN